jgi:hypothetical protein
MRWIVVSVAILSATLLPAFAQTADDVARRAIDVLAGPAWEKARYFAFTFTVEREGKIVVSFPQRWDRYTGHYRVSGKDPQGDDFLVIMNVNTKQGRAWKNGQEVADSAELLALGYRRFINDTYWLLMPLKSMDPGVNRQLTGERTDACGRVWDVVQLSFNPGVGLTPGDHYWMYVNRSTGVVERWDMKLQSMKPEEAPSEVYFHDYGRHAGLLLSTRREIRGRNQFILLNDLTVATEVPGGAFAP